MGDREAGGRLRRKHHDVDAILRREVGTGGRIREEGDDVVAEALLGGVAAGPRRGEVGGPHARDEGLLDGEGARTRGLLLLRGAEARLGGGLLGPRESVARGCPSASADWAGGGARDCNDGIGTDDDAAAAAAAAGAVA